MKKKNLILICLISVFLLCGGLVGLATCTPLNFVAQAISINSSDLQKGRIWFELYLPTGVYVQDGRCLDGEDLFVNELPQYIEFNREDIMPPAEGIEPIKNIYYSSRSQKNDWQLIPSDEYRITYTNNNMEHQTATVEIRFSGQYSGNLNLEFQLIPCTGRPLDQIEIKEDDLINGNLKFEIYGQVGQTSEIQDVEYFRTEYSSGVEPILNVFYQEMTLVPYEDYQIFYSNNENVGEANVEISFGGKYTGTVNTQFTIIARKVETFDLGLEAGQEVEYTGKEIKFLGFNQRESDSDIVIGVKNSGLNEVEALEAEQTATIVYQKNTELSKTENATINVTLGGNFTGSASASFKIIPRKLTNKNITVTFNEDEYVYSGGTGVEPTLTIHDDLGNLLKGTNDDADYELSYRNNTAASENAEVEINFKGNYEGRQTRTFVINPLTLSNDNITIDPIPACDYTGEAQEPKPIIKYNGSTLAEETDYSLSYSNNENAGEGKIIIQFKNNYKGSADAEFTITISSIDDVEYSGQQITPAFEVNFKTKKLELDKDYDCTFGSNTNAGTASINITFKGNYSGSATANFTILQAENEFTKEFAIENFKVGDEQIEEPSVEAAFGVVSIKYFDSNNKECSFEEVKSHAGKYKAVVSVEETTNFKGLTQEYQFEVLQNSSMQWWIWILVALIVLVLGAIVTVIIIKFSKKTDKSK